MINTVTGEILDEFEPQDDVELGDVISAQMMLSKGAQRSKFRREDVRIMRNRLTKSGVLPKFAEWRHEDRDGKHAGGRPSLLTDEQVMVAAMLVRSEGQAFLVTEVRNVLWFRLTENARRELGIDHLPNSGDDEKDAVDWYHRVRRALRSIIDLMDAWPGPRVLMDREQRAAVLSLRDRNTMRRRQERAAWFSSALLAMTFRALPRDVRRRWKGSVAVDQTYVDAVSAQGPRKFDKATGLEEAKFRRSDGKEVPRHVLDPDAGYYPKKFQSDKDIAEHGPSNDFGYGYLLSAAVMTGHGTGADESFPPLALAASVNKPNFELADETLRPLAYALRHGVPINRLTGDGAYGPGQSVENFHERLRGLGVGQLMQPKADQLGVRGGYAGSLQVEGNHYCCATPENLLNASIDHRKGLIDDATWHRRVEERSLYMLRRKEKPDEHGNVPMMCPAIGPQAKVECPLREIHPQSSKKAKPEILNAPSEDQRDRICRQTSVVFPVSEGQKLRQELIYGTEEWAAAYRHDRNTVESWNREFKYESSSIAATARRRMRGLGAAQFMFVLEIMQRNFARIASFFEKEARKKTAPAVRRRRDRDGLSHYVMNRGPKAETFVAVPGAPPKPLRT